MFFFPFTSEIFVRPDWAKWNFHLCVIRPQMWGTGHKWEGLYNSEILFSLSCSRGNIPDPESCHLHGHEMNFGQTTRDGFLVLLRLYENLQMMKVLSRRAVLWFGNVSSSLEGRDRHGGHPSEVSLSETMNPYLALLMVLELWPPRREEQINVQKHRSLLEW